MKTKTVQLNINRYKTQITQLAISEVPCFLCTDNIACTETKTNSCPKLNQWLGLPLTLQDIKKQNKPCLPPLIA